MKEENKPEIVKVSTEIKTVSYDVQLRDFENGLQNFLATHNLPTEGIFVGIPERTNVFKNVDTVLDQVGYAEKEKSIYLSKFIAGVASGLFDAALNYLWDETILQIRKRVIQYDIEYFYDNAVTNVDRRKKLKDESDLTKVDDYDLIKGAKEIGLISDLGFKHLEYINYMRNWASAAHPNQNEITGLQLVSWLETCVKEVITLPISDITIQIKQLLVGVKNTSISDKDAQEISVFTTELTQEQIDNLASGFFGIYVKPDTDSQTHQNINKLLPFIWGRVDEDNKQTFGLKYANFVASNSQTEKKLARQFLQVVDAESYIPDDLRAIEIETAIENLLSAHRNFNNFYNEPSFARQLKRIVGEPLKVPKAINKRFVMAIVEVFLTNGNGVATGANTIYEDILSNLDAHQANIAALSFSDTKISSRLQFSLCQRKFKELLNIVKPSITSPPVNDLIQKIEDFKGNPSRLMNDKTIKTSFENLKTLLK
ncbi:hypothetical protein [Christiangramia flava]|uniref:Uncharacterized protein n=1 Tax=Christiangramia flava JLT2011 TaxID=1229726 RepID=A0A1L7I8H7_9FLAO|nr:hypothetical protein [Christiangramia flava]APU69405.1 hypothetical protein GRFL_2681 [Christiangramia flava JLT2011]OSS37727.1 hypothetical protein C723_3360 [Christiangramia flava JLT2011]